MKSFVLFRENVKVVKKTEAEPRKSPGRTGHLLVVVTWPALYSIATTISRRFYRVWDTYDNGNSVSRQFYMNCCSLRYIMLIFNHRLRIVIASSLRTICPIYSAYHALNHH